MEASYDFDCAVVGGGPAGLVSALYLGRYQRSVVQFNFGTPRASWIPRTHNLLGYRGGIAGTELLRRLEAQVNDVGVERREGEVTVHKSKGIFVLKEGETEIRARRVILATGVQDVQPLIPNLDKLRRKGLLRYCPICDAFEYRKNPILVLAQDDHGIRTAIFLSRFGSRVDVLVAEEQKVPSSLLKKCAPTGICIIRGTLQGIDASEKGGVWVKVEGRAAIHYRVAYVALGVIVNDVAFRSFRSLERAEDGRLIVDTRQKLGIPGLFAVGDCTEALAQISVAAGQAATAATAIHNELSKEEMDSFKQGARSWDQNKARKRGHSMPPIFSGERASSLKP